MSNDFQERLTRVTDTIEKQVHYIETLESLLLSLQKLNVEGSHDEPKHVCRSRWERIDDRMYCNEVCFSE